MVFIDIIMLKVCWSGGKCFLCTNLAYKNQFGLAVASNLFLEPGISDEAHHIIIQIQSNRDSPLIGTPLGSYQNDLVLVILS